MMIGEHSRNPDFIAYWYILCYFTFVDRYTDTDPLNTDGSTDLKMLALLVYFNSVFLDIDNIVVSVFSLSEDCQSLQAMCVLHHHHLVTG